MYNNADSFAMAFDDEWKKLKPSEITPEISQEEKIKLVMTNLKEHPFAQSSPSMANAIAKFRIKLIGLE